VHHASCVFWFSGGQKKTGAEIDVPLLPELAAAIAAMGSGKGAKILS
jgi:hypothetical protein